MQFFDEEFAEFLGTFADFEDAGEDAFAGSEPLVVVGALCVDEDVDLGDEEVFGELADFVLIDADDLGDLLYDMEVGFAVLDVGLEHVEERLEVLLFDQGGVFGEGDAQNGDDSSLLSRVRLLPLIPDEDVPHVREGLRLYYHQTLAH